MIVILEDTSSLKFLEGAKGALFGEMNCLLLLINPLKLDLLYCWFSPARC